MSRVTVVSPAEEMVDRVATALGNGAEEYIDHWWDESLAGDPVLGAGDILLRQPSIVLFEATQATKAIALEREDERLRPNSASVLAAEPTPDLYAEAMRAGIVDIIPPDASTKTIEQRLLEALDRTDRLKASSAAAVKVGQLGSVATAIEPKGGAGKTSIVGNLAVVLAQRFPGEVVLVDLDLQFGDLTEAMLLQPRYTFSDVVRAGSALDATSLKAFLTRREGLFVMAAPGEPEEADSIGPEHVLKVLDLLRPDFRFVLVDTAGGLTDHTLAAVEASTDLLLVSSLDVLANKAMTKTLRILDSLGIVGPRRHLILNRADSKVGLDRTEAIMQLGLRRAIEIPSSRAMPTSLNRGQPIVEAQPRSAISKRIADLAEELIAAQTASEEWSRG